MRSSSWLRESSVWLRKAACAALPSSVWLSRRLDDGTIVGGQNRPGYGGRGLFVFGDQLEPELTMLPSLLHEGGVLIDVGANTGAYSLVGARLVGPTGTVLSLEPNPVMLAALDRNVRRNRYQNVRLRGVGAADSCGESSFYENLGRPNAFSLVRRNDSARFSILTVTLDALAAWERLDRVDVVKIDAEGAEDRVLAGAAGIIERHRPAIIAEVTLGGLTRVPEGYEVRHTGGPNVLLLAAERAGTFTGR